MKLKDDVLEIKKEVDEVKNKSFAMELISDARKANKRMFIIIIILIVAFIGLLGYTIYLLNDIGTIETTTEDTKQEKKDTEQTKIQKEVLNTCSKAWKILFIC